MTFAEQIKQYREQSGKTQAEFARALNVSWITVWRWENDQHRPADNVIDFWLDKASKI